MKKRGRPPHPDVLTPREWEVLALLREGLSNEQIAERLEITERTARYHVSEILSKLGVASREEAARSQPEERRRWWQAAFAPAALLWKRAHLGWAPAAAAGGVAVAVALGLGMLVWGLVNTDGAETRVAVVSEPGVYLVKPDGSDLRRLPGAGSLRDAFAWAPSGSGFALAPACVSENKLFIGSTDDDELRTLASLPNEAGSISFSPDGRNAAINLSEGAGLAAGAVFVDMEPGTLTTIPGAQTFLGWSYDGRRYAIYDDAAPNWYEQTVTVVDTETGERGSLGEGARNALWSPVDDRLAVTRMDGPDEPPFNAWLASGIDVFQGGRTELTTLLPLERHAITSSAAAVAWSPDGRRLLVKTGASPFRFLVYDVDAPGQPRDLGETFKLSWAYWSPTGEYIALERGGAPYPEVFLEVVSATGEGAKADISLSDYLTKSGPFSPGGQQIAFPASRSDDRDAMDIYVADPAIGEPNLLVDAGGMSASVAGWSPDGSYLAFTVGPITSDGC